MAKAPATRTRPGEGLASPVEDRLEQLSAQFEQLKAQVRQAQQLAGLGTAAAMLAHEANNLLTPIRAYAEYALSSDDPQLMRKALSVTIKNSHMVIAMASRILEISAAKPRKAESVTLRTIVDGALESLCRDLSKDGIDLAVDIDESLTVQADSLQIQQVLFNLFLNAREAMSAAHSGRLAVSANRNGDRVVLEIRNTGDPIPPELLPHLFEPFQTSKPVERNGRRRCGGIGLALCRDLIEENQGTIAVESEQGKPTTFTLTLPIAPCRAS